MIDNPVKQVIVQKVEASVQQLRDGLITWDVWYTTLLRDITTQQVLMADMPDEDNDEIRTAVVFQHKNTLSADYLHEHLCKAIHEGDMDSLIVLNGTVTDIAGTDE